MRDRQLPIRGVHGGVVGILAAATLAVALPGCARHAAGASAPAVAVSNSYLAAALRALLDGGVNVTALAPPGTCPGHFDLRPSQVSELRGCSLLLRFDFQQGIDDKLGPLIDGGLRVEVVRPVGGLCVPATYRGVCRSLAPGLVAAKMLSASAAQDRLRALQIRLDELELWAPQRVNDAGLRGASVLASPHQAEFCRFLGLVVAGTFSGADTATAAEIEAAVRAGPGVCVIVANQPEGRRLADALGERLSAPVVVFDNFPAGPDEPDGFTTLVHANVERLVGVVRR